ncbi:MAG TPA: Amuc_1099 family pilus-like system protein [Chthoniobacterales bacterium]|nr:Amuc_1099 family pilus-like system protein [Chthoniobacterales bacterium]
MDWLRAHYDRAAVFAAALFLFLCALFIFLGANGFNERFSEMQNAVRPNNKIPAGRAPEIAETIEKLQKPPQWTFVSKSGLFVPEKHFIGANGQPATLKNTLLHPPVPNEWLEQFGLPITEGDVLTQDADADGFNNLEEWEGHSNPTDKTSHPPYVALLKLKAFAREPFPLVFSDSVGDTYAINNIDPRVPTQFLKKGDMIAGTKFKITGYTEKFETNEIGTKVDVSELTVEQVESHDKVTLVRTKTTTSPESVAGFIYTWGGTEQTFAVKEGQEFSLKPQEGIKYKLVDVSADKAAIVNTQKPNEKIEIPLATAQ